MSYTPAELLLAIKNVGSLPDAKPYQGELTFIAGLVASTAISSSHLKKTLAEKIAASKGMTEGEAPIWQNPQR